MEFLRCMTSVHKDYRNKRWPAATPIKGPPGGKEVQLFCTYCDEGRDLEMLSLLKTCPQVVTSPVAMTRAVQRAPLAMLEALTTFLQDNGMTHVLDTVSEATGDSLLHVVVRRPEAGEDLLKFVTLLVERGDLAYLVAHSNKEDKIPLHLCNNVEEVEEYLKALYTQIRTCEDTQGRFPFTLLASASTLPPEGYTWAHMAAIDDRLGTIKKYVDEKCECFFAQPDCAGNLPLHLATQGGFKDIVELLLRHHPEGSRLPKNFSGRTPLHMAAWFDKPDLARLFLARDKTELSVLDAEIKDPLFLASQAGSVEVLKVFLEVVSCKTVDMRAKPAWKEACKRSATKEIFNAWFTKREREEKLEEKKEQVQSIANGVLRTLFPTLRPPNIVVTPSIDSPFITALKKNKFKLGDEKCSIPEDLKDSPEGPLYFALAYALNPNVCDPEDVKGALDQYRPSGKDISHLALLAHARCPLSVGDVTMRYALFSLFRDQSPTSCEWLSPDELTFLRSDPWAKSDTSKPGEEVPPLAKEWEELKKMLKLEQQKPMEELMKMVGLTSVKKIALGIYKEVLANQRLKEKGFTAAATSPALNFAFLGNPGTGKTTVGRIFADLLHQAGARAGNKFVNLTGNEALLMGEEKFAAQLETLTGGKKGVAPPPTPLRKGLKVTVRCEADRTWYPGVIGFVNQGPDGDTYDIQYSDNTEERTVPAGRIKTTPEEYGGVLLLDEAYDLDPSKSPEGKAILSSIMAAAEDHRTTLTIILAGYQNDIEQKLYSFNPGIASRFRSVMFEDFTEDALCEVFSKMCKDKELETETPKVGLVAGRRLARGIGHTGFGNAREARVLFETAVTNAKKRFFEQNLAKPVIRMTDVIGEDPSTNAELKRALEDLHKQVGLQSVKDKVQQIVKQAESNYRKQLCGERQDDVSLNQVFLGNPGTGKTTTAKIYGRVLKALNLLSDGQVVFKTASDFVGKVVGESQDKTANILKLATGKVLLIDEAYGLNDGLYGKQVLDTITEKVQGRPGEDIAVIMIGYKGEITKMLREQNPGLSRRFNLANPFEFEDFNDEELLKIIALKLRESSVKVPVEVKRKALEVVRKGRNLPNFGNAGAVDILLGEAKRRMAARNATTMSIEDVAGPPKRDAMVELAEMEDVGGFKERLQSLGKELQVKRREGQSTDDCIGHFVFTGAPGTGKTTVARLMGRVLHAYGFTASDHVVETSGTGMAGQFVGQTKATVKEKFEAARGGVLFIDEAYDLTLGGFGQEVVSEMLTLLTQPEYRGGRTVVVIAGYRDRMHAMFEVNEGLKSRFTEFIHFDSWTPETCIKAFTTMASTFVPPLSLGDGVVTELRMGFQELSRDDRPGWANGRDIVAVFKSVVRRRNMRVYETPERESSLILSDVKQGMDDIIKNRPLKTHVRLDPNVAVNQSNMGKTVGRTQQPPPAPVMTTSTVEKVDEEGEESRAKVKKDSPPPKKKEVSKKALPKDRGAYSSIDDGDLQTVYDALTQLNFTLDIRPRGHATDLSDRENQRRLVEMVMKRNPRVQQQEAEAMTKKLAEAAAAEKRRKEKLEEEKRKEQEELQRKLEAEQEEQRRKELEAELERKRRTKPYYLCAVCGREGCPVAPYLAGYRDG